MFKYDEEKRLGTNNLTSCDHFGRHGEWKTFLATKILVKVANWRPKEKLTWKIINNRTNLINSTSGNITCLLLSPLVVQKLGMNV